MIKAQKVRKMISERALKNVILLIIVCFFMASVITHFTKELWSGLSYHESDLIPLTYSYSNDVEKKGDTYTVTGDDPYIIFSTPYQERVSEEDQYLGLEPRQYEEGILVFADKIKNRSRIQIYFAHENKGFSEENSEWYTLSKDAKSLVFSLKNKSQPVSSVRIDLDQRSKDVFSIASVNIVKPTILTVVHTVSENS